MKKVVIVPWLHNIKYLGHKRVVDFIRSLPFGSHIAIEFESNIARKLPFFLEKLKLSGTDISRMDTAFISQLDLFRLFLYKDSNVYPIEENGTEERATLNGIPGSLEYLRDLARYNQRRESYMSSRVLKILDSGVDTIYVVVGASHSIGLKDLLIRQRIETEIPDQLFSSKKDRKKFEEATQEYSDAIAKFNPRSIAKANASYRDTSMYRERPLEEVGLDIQNISRDLLRGRLQRATERMFRYQSDDLPKREVLITPYEPHIEKTHEEKRENSHTNHDL